MNNISGREIFSQSVGEQKELTSSIEYSASIEKYSSLLTEDFNSDDVLDTSVACDEKDNDYLSLKDVSSPRRDHTFENKSMFMSDIVGECKLITSPKGTRATESASNTNVTSTLSKSMSRDTLIEILDYVQDTDLVDSVENEMFLEFRGNCRLLANVIDHQLSRNKGNVSLFEDFVLVCGHLLKNNEYLLGISTIFDMSSFPWDPCEPEYMMRHQVVLTVIKQVVVSLGVECPDSKELNLMRHILALVDLENRGKNLKDLIPPKPHSTKRLVDEIDDLQESSLGPDDLWEGSTGSDTHDSGYINAVVDGRPSNSEISEQDILESQTHVDPTEESHVMGTIVEPSPSCECYITPFSGLDVLHHLQPECNTAFVASVQTEAGVDIEKGDEAAQPREPPLISALARKNRNKKSKRKCSKARAGDVNLLDESVLCDEASTPETQPGRLAPMGVLGGSIASILSSSGLGPDLLATDGGMDHGNDGINVVVEINSGGMNAVSDLEGHVSFEFEDHLTQMDIPATGQFNTQGSVLDSVERNYRFSPEPYVGCIVAHERHVVVNPCPEFRGSTEEVSVMVPSVDSLENEHVRAAIHTTLPTTIVCDHTVQCVDGPDRTIGDIISDQITESRGDVIETREVVSLLLDTAALISHTVSNVVTVIAVSETMVPTISRITTGEEFCEVSVPMDASILHSVIVAGQSVPGAVLGQGTDTPCCDDHISGPTSGNDLLSPLPRAAEARNQTGVGLELQYNDSGNPSANSAVQISNLVAGTIHSHSGKSNRKLKRSETFIDVPTLEDVNSSSSEDEAKPKGGKHRKGVIKADLSPVTRPKGTAFKSNGCAGGGGPVRSSVVSTREGPLEREALSMEYSSLRENQLRKGYISSTDIEHLDTRVLDAAERVFKHDLSSTEWEEAVANCSDDGPVGHHSNNHNLLIRNSQILACHYKHQVVLAESLYSKLLDDLKQMNGLESQPTGDVTSVAHLQCLALRRARNRQDILAAAIHVGESVERSVLSQQDYFTLRGQIKCDDATAFIASIAHSQLGTAANKLACVNQLQVSNALRLSKNIHGLKQSNILFEQTIDNHSLDARVSTVIVEDSVAALTDQTSGQGVIDSVSVVDSECGLEVNRQFSGKFVGGGKQLAMAVDTELDNSLNMGSEKVSHTKSFKETSHCCTSVDYSDLPGVISAYGPPYSDRDRQVTQAEKTKHLQSEKSLPPKQSEAVTPGAKFCKDLLGEEVAWNKVPKLNRPLQSETRAPNTTPLITILDVQQISHHYGWSWLYDITPAYSDRRGRKLDACPSESHWKRGRPGLTLHDYEIFCLNQMRKAHAIDPYLLDKVRRCDVFESIQYLKIVAARGRVTLHMPNIASMCGMGDTDNRDVSINDTLVIDSAVFSGVKSAQQPQTTVYGSSISAAVSLEGLGIDTNWAWDDEWSTDCSSDSNNESESDLPGKSVLPPHSGVNATSTISQAHTSTESSARDVTSCRWDLCGGGAPAPGTGSVTASVTGAAADSDTAGSDTAGISPPRLRADLLKLFMVHTDTDTPEKISELEANLEKNFSDEKIKEIKKNPKTSHSVKILLTQGVPLELLSAESAQGKHLCDTIFWDTGASLHITDFLSSLMDVVTLLKPVQVHGVGSDVSVTHKGFDPRWTGRFHFLSGGAGICVLSVGEACRPDHNGQKGYFVFSNFGAFTSRTTEEIKFLLRMLKSESQRAPGYAEAIKEHNVYVQRCTPATLANAKAQLRQTLSEQADLAALATILSTRTTALQSLVASHAPANAPAIQPLISTSTPAPQRNRRVGGGGVTGTVGPIAKASVLLMIRVKGDDTQSKTSTVQDSGVNPPVNQRKRRGENSTGLVETPEERGGSRSDRMAKRNMPSDRGNYKYDPHSSVLTWSRWTERLSSVVVPRVGEYYASVEVANEKFFSSVTESSSRSSARGRGKTVSERHVTGGGSSWTSRLVSEPVVGLSETDTTRVNVTGDDWTDPFPMHLRTSVCDAIRNSQTDREDSRYAQIKALPGPIDPSNLAIRTDLREYTVASWNRAGLDSGHFADNRYGASSNEVRELLTMSNLQHEMDIWDSWRSCMSNYGIRNMRRQPSIMQNWGASDCGIAFPLKEGQGRSPVEFLRERTLSPEASCRLESVLVGGELASRMESVVRQYDLHKSHTRHIKVDGKGISPDPLGADFDYVLWNCEPDMAMLIEMTHCLLDYKQEIIQSMYMAHPSWMDLILANELAETTLHLQIMSSISLRAVENLKRHYRYIIMFEQVIKAIERHGSALAPELYHTLIPSLTGELGPATVRIEIWPGIPDGIANLRDMVSQMREHAIREAGVSLSESDMGIYAESILVLGDMNLIDQINIHDVLLIVYSQLCLTQGPLRQFPPEYFALNESIIRHFCRTTPSADGVMRRFSSMIDTLVRFGPYVDENTNRQKSVADRQRIFQIAAGEEINDTPAFVAVVAEIVDRRVRKWNVERDRQLVTAQAELRDMTLATDADGHVHDSVIRDAIVARVYSSNSLSYCHSTNSSSSSTSNVAMNTANFMGGSLLSLEHMVVRSIIKLATSENVVSDIIQGIRRLKHTIGLYSRNQPQYDVRALALVDVPLICRAGSIPLATYRDVLEFMTTNCNKPPTHRDVVDTLVQSLRGALDGEINFLNNQDLESLLTTGCHTISAGSVDGASESPIISSYIDSVTGRVAGGGFLHDPIIDGPIDDPDGVFASSTSLSEQLLMIRTEETVPRKVLCCQGLENDFVTSQVRGGCTNGCCTWAQLHSMMIAKGYTLAPSNESIRLRLDSELLHAQVMGSKGKVSRKKTGPFSNDTSSLGNCEGSGLSDSSMDSARVLDFLSRHIVLTPEILADLESSTSIHVSEEMVNGMKEGKQMESVKASVCLDGVDFVQSGEIDIAQVSAGSFSVMTSIELARRDLDDLIESSYEDQAECEALHIAALEDERSKYEQKHILEEECLAAHVVVEDRVLISQAELDDHAERFHKMVEATYGSSRQQVGLGHGVFAEGALLQRNNGCDQEQSNKHEQLSFKYRDLYDGISSWLPSDMWRHYVVYIDNGSRTAASCRVRLQKEFPLWDLRLLGYIHVARSMVQSGDQQLAALGQVIDCEKVYRLQFTMADLDSRGIKHLGVDEMCWILSTLNSVRYPWNGFMNLDQFQVGGLRATPDTVKRHSATIYQKYPELTEAQVYLLFVVQWTCMNLVMCMHDISWFAWDVPVVGQSLRNFPRRVLDIVKDDISRYWELAHGDGNPNEDGRNRHLRNLFQRYFPSLATSSQSW